MMTSPQAHDVGNNFKGRRGHGNQISISDPRHHVTEAIGTMYDDSDDTSLPLRSHHRPLSFSPSEYAEKQLERPPHQIKPLAAPQDGPPNPSLPMPDQGTLSGALDSAMAERTNSSSERPQLQRNGSADGVGSPISSPPPRPSLQDMRDGESNSHLPLANMNDPNDIALEFSNLQALRRMSMDVGIKTDPDLLLYYGMSLKEMPSVAPTGDDDESDPSRLLWVPARVHPELEPSAFKNFLESRVQSIKRRSAVSMLSANGSAQADNAGNLRRKESTLSRQIHSYGEMHDGDETQNTNGSNSCPLSGLRLDELVKDPTRAVQKLTQGVQRQESILDSGVPGDIPILLIAPGKGLRRSTNTTYRKGGGSVRAGDRPPFPKRARDRSSADKATHQSQVSGLLSGPSTARAQPDVESMPNPNSRPTDPRGLTSMRTGSLGSLPDCPQTSESTDYTSTTVPLRQSLPSSTSLIPSPPPAPPQSSTSKGSRSAAASLGGDVDSTSRPQPQIPSSQPLVASGDSHKIRSKKASSAARMGGPSLQDSKSSIMADEPTSHSNEPVHITPASTEFKRSTKKTKDADEGLDSSRPSGWKWFKSEEKEKRRREKERDKEREMDDQLRRAKDKAEKLHDGGWSDTLASSMENAPIKGRESLLLDRESFDSKVTEERKKEGHRRAGESGKNREGFFGGLFGGSRKRSDKDEARHSGKGKDKQRAFSPSPTPLRPMRPDVDYAWTRFSIVEERAIYRMAHIKLANPRRNLLSQVLLSNFMYSYLAKVQAMHPQFQVPISPQQKRQEEERKRRELEEQQARFAEQETHHSSPDMMV